MISCILLSAGLSTRFGAAKALALYKGRPIIEHIQNVLLSSSVGEIILVLGFEAEKIEPFLLKHDRIIAVYNKDYNLGQTSSFQTGVRKISSTASGMMLLPIDCPFVKVETFKQLADQFHDDQEFLLIPTYQNLKGHPPIFPIHMKTDILNLDTGRGLNSYAHQINSQTKLFPVHDPAVLYTFNTPQEFDEVKAKVN